LATPRAKREGVGADDRPLGEDRRNAWKKLQRNHHLRHLRTFLVLATATEGI
jgi:hypothetical protein